MIINGDCIEEMQKLIDQGVQVDAVVTDPPYEIGFMGREWDSTGIAYRKETWRLAWELLKPGGHLLAFSASRTYHRMTVAIEDAGFEIRDQMMWLYGSGFPKSHNISKSLDKMAGAEREVVGVAGKSGSQRSAMAGDFKGGEYNTTSPATDEAQQWDGWGTALKPAHEPIAVGRKPLSEGTVAKNVLKHGTGGINIDASRIPTNPAVDDARLGGKGSWKTDRMGRNVYIGGYVGKENGSSELGRFPANIMHDGSEEVVKLFPESNSARVGNPNNPKRGTNHTATSYGQGDGKITHDFRDKGSASRYFYCPKVSKKERGENNKHPTVKPQELMKYLIRMVTPKGGTVLDPFMGSGSTGMAAKDLEFNFIGIEMDEEYFKICQERIEEINPLGEFLE
jgi:DNA modification methylase|tara:strand:+ start:7801 stop:8985 length:1185 start_codon:yes stop_codon:yes gene_type:complete